MYIEYQMYIEYVTYDDYKVLHQLRKVESGADAKETMENAVKRLEATGFRRMGQPGNFRWTNGQTDAYIHLGNLATARTNIKRAIRRMHEYNFLN